MSNYNLRVPNDDFNLEWMRFGNSISTLDLDSCSTLTIDFGPISFLSPSQFVLLACSIEYLHSKFKVEIVFIGGTSGLNHHLNNIKFKLYWTSNFNRDNYTMSRNNSTLCLWHICQNMIDQYGQQAQVYFRNTFFSNKDLQPLSQSLVEVFNNIFDHAESPIQGYVITQFFPNLNKLTFAVCDFGLGIPTTINKYLYGNKSVELKHNLAIEKALERGMTIRSLPYNAGFGLANVLDFIDDSKGKLSIFSNTGYYIKKWDNEAKSGILSYPFNGTLIIVDVDTTTFDEFDSEDGIYEF